MTPETYERILAEIRATPETPAANVASCGACGFRWDDINWGLRVVREDGETG